MSSLSLQIKLNSARQELLDLGLRNPLLNYRALKARGLDIVDERPGEIMDILVRSKRRMSFLPRQQAAEQKERADLEAGVPVDPQSFKDAKLQTNYSDKQLQSRLLNTYTAARTYVEEQGVNILYMALGMLNWYETDSSGDRRQAPLVLVPVQIERVSARERFTVVYTEDEIGHNVSLVAKLKHDFGVSLPEWEEEEEELTAYFARVESAVEGQGRWSVDREAVAIGFFSFGKFLMYRDLDADHWPEHAGLLKHPIMAALLGDGFREPPSAIQEDEHLDRHLRPEASNLVKEADSSQLLAIMDANQGRNLVIQGPPGTGKSQTITNLIAEAVGQGKKVLFVSEKMAALEVVKRRLDEAGLGIACLELHSHKMNKKTLLKELAETLDLGRPLQSPSKGASALSELRDRLNAYCEAMHTPIGASGATPYTALGQLMLEQAKAQETASPAAKIKLELLSEWTEEEYAKRELMLEELQRVLGETGIPGRHPFWGSRKALYLPHELEELQMALSKAAEAVSQLADFQEEWKRTLEWPGIQSSADAEELLKTAKRTAFAPDLTAVNVASERWSSDTASLKQLAQAGQKATQLRAEYEKVLIESAWELDLLHVRQSIVNGSGRWWSFLSGDYRKAKRTIRGLFRSPGKVEIDALKIIDVILEARHAAQNVATQESVVRELLGTQWKGLHTDWAYMESLLETIPVWKREIAEGKLPSWTLTLAVQLQTHGVVNQFIKELGVRLGAASEETLRLQQLLEFDGRLRFKDQPQQELLGQTLESLLRLFVLWRTELSSVQTLASFNRLAGQCEELGLEPYVRLAEAWEPAVRQLMTAFRRQRNEALVVRAFREREPLSLFEGSQHEHAIEKFCELDIDLTHRNRYKLAEAHWRLLPQYDAGGQLGILRREFEKKSRHLPIRQLMTRAGQAIQAIKPVFMMGPLSIASYIQPGSLEFDLVVFDEASQVKPVDAFGAILRGKQIVVVGDSKQMPPTNFFESISKEEENPEDDESFVGDMESILGLCLGQNAPQRMLRWHYRSRHESLIAVSNQEFYDRKLVVFPSPDAQRLNTGLIARYMPNSSYDRGKTRTNPLEAKAIAEAVMAFAKTTPQLSLGVAAFSMAQMQAILDELELLRKADPACESFFAGHPHEPFFVKNLENVQGDERDVIMISIGYGRTSDGSLAMDFGALNREGGERRLNVLITRARLRCEVFTNLRADDLDLNRSGARGVKALKTFLQYAESGRLSSTQETGMTPPSASFEEAVYRRLSEAGYQVKRQVGSMGYSMDLAVVDPEKPGRYLLGIQCDGSTYSSARSARDRDRLRKQVLEGLGWQLHRIWSADWYRSPERELKRVIDRIEQLRGKQEQAAAFPMGKPELLVREDIERESVEESTDELTVHVGIRYEQAELGKEWADQELQELPLNQLASLVLEIVKVESPVHKSEIVRRLSEAAGIKRISPRIHEKVDEAVRLLELRDKINPMGDFLWLPGMSIPPVRDRSGLALRKLELIAPQELAAAILQAVRDSYGMERGQVPQAVCQLLGLSRATDDVKQQVEELLLRLVAKQQLVERGSQIFLAG